MIGPQQHRDALVFVRNPVVLVPVRAAPFRGGAEDVSARHAERVGVGVAGVGELRLALEHQEPGPPVRLRDQHGAARVSEQVLELHPGLRDRDPDAAIAGVRGDDAELRHPVATERGQHALRVVMDELFDLGCELGCHRHLLRSFGRGAIFGACAWLVGGSTTRTSRFCSSYPPRTTTPHATRAPLFPAGSVRMSSGPSCTTRALPTAPNREFGPASSVTRGFVTSRWPWPVASTVMLGRSPA